MKLTAREYRFLKWLIRKDPDSIDQIPAASIGRLRLMAREEYVVFSEETGFVAGVTVEGRHAMELYRDVRAENLWTRGLAIAAIIISLLSLLATSQWLQEALGQALRRLPS